MTEIVQDLEGNPEKCDLCNKDVATHSLEIVRIKHRKNLEYLVLCNECTLDIMNFLYKQIDKIKHFSR